MTESSSPFERKAIEKSVNQGNYEEDPMEKLLQVQNKLLEENAKLTEAKIHESQITEENLRVNKQLLEETEKKTRLIESALGIMTDLTTKIEQSLIPEIGRLSTEVSTVVRFMEILLQFFLHEYSAKGNKEMISVLTDLLNRSKQNIKVITDDVTNASDGNINFGGP